MKNGPTIRFLKCLIHAFIFWGCSVVLLGSKKLIGLIILLTNMVPFKEYDTSSENTNLLRNSERCYKSPAARRLKDRNHLLIILRKITPYMNISFYPLSCSWLTSWFNKSDVVEIWRDASKFSATFWAIVSLVAVSGQPFVRKHFHSVHSYFKLYHQHSDMWDYDMLIVKQSSVGF